MLRSTVILSVILATSLPVFALDSTDVLPAHINSPSVRIGTISGTADRYDSSGTLMSLTDGNSITFDAKKLVQVEPRVQQLISVLNQFGQQQMGNALTLGTLHIDIAPNVNYYAPVHAYGITDKWTIAVGVPVIHYKNNISLSQEGSNLDAIQKQAGGISPDLDSAFAELRTGLVQSAQSELIGKGYKPLQNVDTTFLGDMEIASLYQIFNNKRTALLSKTTLTLPTGPKDDPDDLTDLDFFGQTAIEEEGILTYMITPKWRLSGISSVNYYLPDQITKRVPTSSDDTLPDASTKENVSQQIGSGLMVGASSTYWLTDRWSGAAGFDVTTKAADKYSGSSGKRYDLLAASTNSVTERVKLGLTYDTISAYLAKTALFPCMLAFTYTDTVAGVNVSRETINELWLTMFF